MNKQPRSKRYKALALALIAGISGPGQIMAAPSRETSANDTALANSSAGGDAEEALPTAHESVLLVEFGRNALAHVDAAAAALSAEDSTQALLELNDAQKLLQQLSNHARRDLIPVFARIGLTREYRLSKALRKTLGGLTKLALQGNHEQVVEHLQASGAPLGYIHVSMPLSNTIDEVDTALQALHQERLRDAQAAMERIIDNLHTASITVG